MKEEEIKEKLAELFRQVESNSTKLDSTLILLGDIQFLIENNK